MSGKVFGMALLKEHRIAVMPGESFGRAASGRLRVALTVEDTRLREAVATLLAIAARKATEAEK